MNVVKLPSVILATITAIVYNLWLLGFFLNPKAARYGVVSDLGADGQPYNWFFIGGDVVCGLLCLGIIVLILARRIHGWYVYVACLGLGVFGVFTSVSAALPINCSSGLRSCGYNPGQSLGAHDVTSAIAAVGIFIGLIAMWRASTRWQKIFLVNSWVFGMWSIWGLLFAITPLRTVQQLPNIQAIAVIWQQVFLLLTGLAVIRIVYSLELVARKEESTA